MLWPAAMRPGSTPAITRHHADGRSTEYHVCSLNQLLGTVQHAFITKPDPRKASKQQCEDAKSGLPAPFSCPKRFIEASPATSPAFRQRSCGIAAFASRHLTGTISQRIIVSLLLRPHELERRESSTGGGRE